jgi:hypothetical protein
MALECLCAVRQQQASRNLQLARGAGVAEVWLFGVNGLNDEYLSALRETLPLGSIELPRDSQKH